MNLEESEEEAEGGKGLQGTSPAEMLSGCCRTPGAFLLCHGKVWKDAQWPLRGAKKIGLVRGSQEGMPAGASLGCGLAVDPWGEIQPRGSVASLACPCPPPPPPPSHQLIQEGRRRDAPSSAKKRFPTPMCHTMTWHHGIPAVGPHRARRGKRWHHPWLRWRGKVGFPPLIPPRRSFCAP